MSDAYMTALRLALNQRTGRDWRTRRGRGTSIDKVYVTSPPDRKKPELGTMMSREDRAALAEAFDLDPSLVVDMVVVMPAQRDLYLRNVNRE